MVETHNVEFADDDIDGQKIVFFDGKYHEIEDVHIGIMIFDLILMIKNIFY